MTVERQADEHGAAPGTEYDASRLNALRHGVLSKFAVLPWEQESEYRALVDELTGEHQPAGATELHLVLELAGVLWRKRRLRLAEVATYQQGLQATTSSYSKTVQSALLLAPVHSSKVDVATAVRADSSDAKSELDHLEADRAATQEAIEILEGGRNSAYDEALVLLYESTREAWIDQLEWKPGDYERGALPYTADAACLLRYLETEIAPWYDKQRTEILSQPYVRMQALGEALDPDKLERLGRYEVHLDRKFERTLSTLIRLQELRRSRVRLSD